MCFRFLAKHFIVRGVTQEEVEEAEDLPELVFPPDWGFWEIIPKDRGGQPSDDKTK